MKKNRPEWDDYFMSMAERVAVRSACIRRQVGAVAVKNRRIISTGYNGPPSSFPHCTEKTCYRTVCNIPSGQQLDKCYAVHAEANLVTQLGDRLSGARVYVTTQPCATCFKLLYAAGVRAIIWQGTYPDDFTLPLMEHLGRVEYQEYGNRYRIWKKSS